MATQDEIRAVLAATDIVDLIGSDIELRKAGQDHQARCPFHDEKTPSFTVSNSKQFYHCLAGETEVMTLQGTRKIKDLAGEYHTVLTTSGWVTAPFKSYGEQSLYRISLSRNGVKKEVFATYKHRWFVHGVTVARETSELKPGDRLMSVIQPSVDFDIDMNGARHGIVFGDGYYDKKHKYCTVNLHDEKMELASMFSGYHRGTYGRGPEHNYVQARNLPSYLKNLPDIDSEPGYLAGFVAGYIATDGHVSKDGTIMLHCKDGDVLRFVRDVCARIGIVTFGVTNQERNGYLDHPTPIYRIHFATSSMHRDMMLRSKALARFDACTKKYERMRWAVTSVAETDRVETVYCAEVPETHSFVLADNILTGNCFGCGAHGDAIAWMQEYHRMPFRQALEELAGRAGVVLGQAIQGEVRAHRGKRTEAQVEEALHHELLVLCQAIGARVTYRAIPADDKSRYPHIQAVSGDRLEREYEAARRIAKGLAALYGARA